MQFDEKTRVYFNRKVKQVFVYLTNGDLQWARRYETILPYSSG